MKFSLMTRVIYRQTQSQLDAFLHENGIDAEAVKSQGWIVGTAQETIDQLSALVDAGVERFMLQWMEQDDIENLELLARDVLPQFAKSDSTQFVASKTKRFKKRSTRKKGSKMSNAPRVSDVHKVSNAHKVRNAPKVPRIRNVRRTRR